jgi:hypothetical protein
MQKYVNEIAIPLIIAIGLTIIGLNIRRNRTDVFYLEFSQFNLGISIFISLIVLLPLWTNKGKYIFLLFLTFLLFLIINSSIINYKIEYNILIVKKNIFQCNSYDIKEIVSINTGVNLITESPCYKVIMADNRFFLIEKNIENIELFFLRLKEINNEIIFPCLESKKTIYNLLDLLILRIIIPIAFYIIGFKFIITGIK